VIRVALADDHEVVRVGLRCLLALAGDIELVAEASSGQETVDAVARAAPDVLLLDMRMPRGDGLFVLRTLASRGARTATLVLTTFDDDDDSALQAIEAGARGYLLKDVTLERLVAAVRTLAAGGTVLAPGVSEEARHRVAREALVAKEPGFVIDGAITARERQIIRLLAGGYTNREIASALHVAEGTVKNHVSSVLAKMGVRDRTRAVLKAAARGWL
jgi:DNA-binding NarL/FixJ family response regulator